MTGPYLPNPRGSLEQAVRNQRLGAGSPAVRSLGQATVALVSDGDGIAAELARALDGHCTLIVVTDPAELAGRVFHPDAIVMGFTRLAALYAGDPALHTRVSRSSRLLVLAKKTDFLANRDLLGLADA